MQYLCGLSEFTDKPIFDSNLFVTIRKCISEEETNEMTVSLLNRIQKEKESKKQKYFHDESGDGASPDANKNDTDVEFTDKQGRIHKGVLKMNATCTDAEVCYPVDVDIIHDGCKVVGRYIKSLYKAFYA